MTICKLASLSALALGSLMMCGAPNAVAGALPHGLAAPKSATFVVKVHSGHRHKHRYRRYDYDRDVVVDAPAAYVDTRGRRRVWVDAPFTAVRVHPRGVWVRAPFVDLYVPR